MSSFSDRMYQLLGWRKVEPQAIVLFLGLDGSGKSTILNRCAALITTSMGLEENLETRRNDNQSVEIDSVTGILPTQGYDIKSFSLYDLKILAWDVGGQKSLRHGWRKYYTNSQYVIDALVYVIDSTDRRRIAETGNTTEKKSFHSPYITNHLLNILSTPPTHSHTYSHTFYLTRNCFTSTSR